MNFADAIKKPSFWMSALSGLGAIGSALLGTENHVVAAIGAIIVSVYTLSEHLATAIQSGQSTASQMQSDLKAGNAVAAVSLATGALSQQVSNVQQAVTDAQQIVSDAKATAQAIAQAANKAATK